MKKRVMLSLAWCFAVQSVFPSIWTTDHVFRSKEASGTERVSFLADTGNMKLASIKPSLAGEKALSSAETTSTGEKVNARTNDVHPLTSGGTSGVNEADSLALVALYNSTGGQFWSNKINWLSGPVNTWFGITVQNQRVTGVELPDNSLSGTIPGEIGNLTQLSKLLLPANSIGGSLPPGLMGLHELTWLDLSDNRISGTIPAGMGAMVKLERLQLTNNQLSGEIPAELGNLANLQLLYLESNRFSGTIPQELGNLSNLTQLRLGFNSLSGTIPVSLGNLTKLEYLVLDSNLLSGTIPSEVGNLVNLKMLFLRNCQVSGVVPPEIGNLTNLTKLHLENNQFEGAIPAEFGNLKSLVELDLSQNQFEGAIPAEFGNLKSLVELDLSQNHFSGTVPSSLGELTFLNALYLTDNLLQDLPDLSALTNLSYLGITNNSFSFSDFQNTGLDFSTILAPAYSPQSDLDAPSKTTAGDQIILTCTAPATGNAYQWFRADTALEGETSAELTIGANEDGAYYCKVSNADYPKLILSTRPVYVNTESKQGIIADEYDALVAFYNATGGDNWKDKYNWLSAAPVSDWYGIRTEGGHITQIDLQSNNLQGPLPSAIGNFPALNKLSLSDNHLTDTIPETLYELSALKKLQLQNNELEGTVSQFIGQLDSLSVLELGVNNLTGNIPEEIGNLTKLEGINLSANKLTGSLPGSLNNLVNLYFLDVHHNELNVLPDLSSLTGLRFFLINDCRFTFEDFLETGLDFSSFSRGESRQAPLELVNDQLQFKEGLPVTLDWNELTSDTLWSTDNEFRIYKNGSLVLDWTTDPRIEIPSFTSQDAGAYYIEIRNNNFLYYFLRSDTLTVSVLPGGGSPTDATWVSEQDSLALVALYNATDGPTWSDHTNWLSGPVYNWYGTTVQDGRVTKIDLSDNNLSGTLPVDLQQLTGLTSLNLSQNNISGIMPPEIGSMINLRMLDLWDNKFSGPLPSGLGDLTDLEYLDLELNRFTGEIPEEIGNLSNLMTLSLSRNYLTGPIPPSLGNLSQLQNFLLYSNQLSGSIPSELGNLASVYYFDVSTNQLTGQIPESFGNMTDLAYLVLRENQLSGAIPSQLGNLSYMRYLNLSGNRLSGEIPSELGSLSNLYFLNLGTNQLEGEIPSSLGELAGLTTLGLYQNHLSGPVPPQLNNLTNLGILSIEYNELDSLPDLSGLTNLRDLFIYNNRFTLGDLQNTGLDFSSLRYCYYAPQSNLEKPVTTLSGDSIVLRVSATGTGNTYQWYMAEGLIPGETNPELKLSRYAWGFYYCVVWNPAYPHLGLETSPAFINVDGSHGITTEEYDALVALYNSTNGDGWTDHYNWLSEEPADTWKGITISGGHVIGIDLHGNNLSGPLPAEIGDFPALKDLYLYTNHLSDSIPESLYQLTSLRELWLRDNDLEGTISPSIKNLVNLRSLQLRTNDLTGSIPSEIGDLTELTGINLAQTRLSGPLPASFNRLVKLDYLYLFETDLNELPDLSALTSLRIFHVDQCKFTFEDFINTSLDFSSLEEVYYSQQDTLELKKDFLEYDKGEQVILNCRDLLKEDLWSTDNEFLLLRNGQPVYGWSTDPVYTIPSFSDADTGNYSVQVRNNHFPLELLKSETLTIEVIKNRPPGNISISHDTVEENVPVGTIVGVLSAADPDDGDTHTFTLQPGDAYGDGLGNNENDAFTIEGNQLKTAVPFDYETGPEYHIYVKASDAGGLSYEKALIIHVSDVNEAPSALTLSANTVAEDAPVGTIIGQFNTTDPDTGDTFTYTLVSGDGLNDSGNDAFTIEGNELKTAVVPDYETQSEYRIYVRTEDAGGLGFERAFIVSVTDVIETAIDQNPASPVIRMYPNPTTGKIFTELREEGGTIEVVDATGTILLEKRPVDVRTMTDLSHLPRGIYFLRIRQKDRMIIRKIMLIPDH